jgi:hypothetical protein
MLKWDDKKKDLVWEYTGDEQCNSDSETKTITNTTTDTYSDSFNTSNYAVQNYSNLGNVSVGASGITASHGIIFVVVLAVLGVIVLIARRK